MVKKVTAVLLGVFFVLNVEAATVSFMVIETGLPQEDAKYERSAVWENALMDVFFDAGHIVSNAPMLRLETKPAGDLQRVTASDIDEAREGGSDYFIVAQLEYTRGSRTPNEVLLSLFSVTPYKKIHERRVALKSYRSEREELDDLKVIIRGLVSHLSN